MMNGADRMVFPDVEVLNHGGRGVAALYAALLLDALGLVGVRVDTRRHRGTGPSRAAARAWLLGQLDGVVTVPVAFACAAVGLDPVQLGRVVQVAGGPRGVAHANERESTSAIGAGADEAKAQSSARRERREADRRAADARRSDATADRSASEARRSETKNGTKRNGTKEWKRERDRASAGGGAAPHDGSFDG